MAFLDFMKNKPQQNLTAQPPSQTPRPDVSKDVTKVLSPAELSKFREVGERLQKASVHRGGPQLAGAGDGSNSALIQKQQNQNKTQAALSPTDQFKGQTATQNKARGWER